MTEAPEPAPTPHRAHVDTLRARVAEAHRAGTSGRDVARLMSACVEEVVADAFARATAKSSLPGAALVALGGFGRADLAPYSDVDLLLLVPEHTREASDALARELFTPLWDA